MDLDFLLLQEVQCTETLPLKQFAVFCFPADKMNQTVASKVSFWSQMQQSFKSLEIIYCLYVGFEAEEMVVVANLQVDPQQKTL